MVKAWSYYMVAIIMVGKAKHDY